MIKRWLNRLGEEGLGQLLQVKRADCMGQAELCHCRLQELDEIEKMINKLIAEEACFAIKDLALDGNDLLAMGVEKGPTIGMLLNKLLKAVMEEGLANEKEALLNYVKMNDKGDANKA